MKNQPSVLSAPARCASTLAMVVATCGLLQAAPVLAQIRTDSSLGLAAQNLIGPHYQIPQALGRLSGNNLFHSFQTFGINTGESARFTTTTSSIANVISRVTGGSASTINGNLILQPISGTPNFFFINPAGVTFGTGASVNVPGAFYVSTANYVKFPDGNFYSDTVTASTFSNAAPSAFGFLGNSSTAVTALNATPQNVPGQPPRPSMFTGTDKPIHIVAGDVTINNSIIGNESGDVRVVALGRPSQDTQVPLSGSYAGASGTLQILNGGQINSSTNSNKDVGSVQVYAGNITIDKQTATRDTGIISQADTRASGQTGDVTIIASGDLIMANGGKISASNSATAADPTSLTASTLTVMARNISLDNAQILAESRGNVDATTIKVAAAGAQTTTLSASDFDNASFTANGNLTLTNGAWINGNSYLSGNSAPIIVKAGDLSLTGNGRTTLIASSTLSSSASQASLATGDGGSIEITANALSLTKGGQIQSSTVTRGKAGPVTINAGNITIDGQNSAQTGIYGTASRESYGQVGTMTLNAAGGAISVANGGGISVQNDAIVPSGQLANVSAATLTMAAKTITLDSNAQVTASTSGNVDASKIDIRTIGGDITIKNGASIQGSTTGTGNATTIGVNAGGDLTISNGSFINGNTSLSGQASAVSVTAANITLDGNGRGAIISSEANAGQLTAATTGSGNLVEITTPGTLSLINGGQIKSSTNTYGNAGIVKATARDISIDGQSNANSMTGIFNTTTRGGNSEEITITASNDLTVKSLGQINATSTAPTGKAGAITINTGSLTVDGSKAFVGKITLPDGSLRDVNGFVFSNISSEAGTSSSGQTGDVTIAASKGVTLSSGGKISVSNLATVSDPTSINNIADSVKPNLTISAKSISLDSGHITATTSGNLDASKISLTATTGDIDLKNSANIEGSTLNQGNAGIVNLTAANGNVTIGSNSVIQSSTSGPGKAGSVTVNANDITIEGANRVTGISVTANPGSSGYTGNLSLFANGNFTMSKNGGLTAMNLATVSDPDSINKLADSLKPSLLVLAKNVSLDSFAMITAETRGNVDASKIRIAATGPQATSLNAINFDANDFVATGNMSMNNGVSILGNTYLSGKAAPLAIKAGNLTLNGATLSSTANFGATNDAGSIAITVPGKLLIQNGATITTSTHASAAGDAGNIGISAGSITMDNNGNISSDSGVDAGNNNPPTPNSIGKAGSITLNVDGTLAMTRSLIDTTTQSQGSAGHITINAADISLSSASIQSNSKERSKGASGKAGNAGAIAISATGDLTLGSSAASSATLIHSTTSTDGAGGEVTVSAKNITIDTLGYANSLTGMMSLAMPGTTGVATGNAGSVSVTAGNKLSLLNGGAISTTAMAPTGNAGTIDVTADTLVMNGNGTITSDTLGAGSAGSVAVTAKHMTMDASVVSPTLAAPVGNTIPSNFLPLLTKVFSQGARVSSQAFDTASGDAGQVKVNIAQDLSVLKGSQISSATYSASGAAKDVVVNASSLLLDGSYNGKASSISAASANRQSSGQTGTVKVVVTGDATLSNGGTLSLSNDAIVPSSRLASITPTTLELTANNITLDSNAQVTAATAGNVDASNIALVTTGNLVVKANALIQGSTSNAGDAGVINLTATNGNVSIIGGSVQSVTSGPGKAGAITLSANDVTLEGSSKPSISVTANAGSSGLTGSLTLLAKGNLSMSKNAALTAMNLATVTDPDSINNLADTSKPSLLVLAKNISLDTNAAISAETHGNVDGSNIKVAATGTQAAPVGSLNFSSLDATGALSIGRGGSINGNTSLSGKGASVSVKAGTVTLDGNGGNAVISAESLQQPAPGAVSAPLATGDGGSVNIAATTLTLTNGGQIKTSTTTFGNSGLATVTAENVLIDGNFNPNAQTGIFGSTGGAGDSREITVTATRDLTIRGLGQISASTSAGGQAGSITVDARTITVDGKSQAKGPSSASSINAEAGNSSSGKTGNIVVRASDRLTLSNGGMLSVQNFARVSAEAATILNEIPDNLKPKLSVSAPDITLKNARITAGSSGNVNASNIDVTFSNMLYLDPSSIATSANTGDGGAINILGGKMIVLDNSQITTSVSGLVGFNGNPANGGNINIAAETLLLQSGFIQANTAASNASGGNVTLALQNLVPSGNSMFLGGQTAYTFVPGIFGFNVIQAAAPTGLSGTIQISSPALDLSGALSGLNAQMINTGGMGRSPCQASVGSSFVQTGRGGFPPSARDLLGPEPQPAAENIGTPEIQPLSTSKRLTLTGLECIDG